MIEAEYAGVEGAPYAKFVESCVQGYPAPAPGKRDNRKHTIQRALKSLSSKKDGPIMLKDGLVIFCVEG